MIMHQKIGQCFIATASGSIGLACVPEPKKFYLLPGEMQRFTEEAYRRVCVTIEEADREIAARQRRLVGPRESSPAQAAAQIGPVIASPWNRRPTAPAAVRG